MSEKQLSEQRYPVMEHFYTIQGEGANSGKPAYFIRLGGCDVGCHWCDVKESWDAAAHPACSIAEMIGWVEKSGAQHVVITGGEPLMYDLTLLTAALKEKGWDLWLETSGAYPVTGYWDWICVSPKKFKQPLASVLKVADELKVIVFNGSDFSWALQHKELTNDQCDLFLQPEWSKEKTVLPLIIDFVKSHPGWRISVQTHKYMNIP